MSNYCLKATKQLAIIKTLQDQLHQKSGSFNADGNRSEKVIQLVAIYQLRKEVKNNTKKLEYLIYPELELAEKLKLREQYDSQVKMLKDSGILRNLGETKVPPIEEYGIIGVDDKEYILPTYEEVLARLRDPEKRGLIEKKFEQGFVKFQIVPFATNISRIIECYKETLLRIHRESGIKATDGTTLDLTTENPLYVWEDLINCDKLNTQRYKQMEYSVTSYAGKTKKARRGRYKGELLQNINNAWQFSLIEDLPNLPAEGKGLTIAGRKQLEANKTPNEYLSLLQDPQNIEYQGESGQTPESALITCLTYLQEKKLAIDDFQGLGKANWLVGTLLAGHVPYIFWTRMFSRPHLHREPSNEKDSSNGVRSQVMF